jgi:hypothetical protein
MRLHPAVATALVLVGGLLVVLPLNAWVQLAVEKLRPRFVATAGADGLWRDDGDGGHRRSLHPIDVGGPAAGVADIIDSKTTCVPQNTADVNPPFKQTLLASIEA